MLSTLLTSSFTDVSASHTDFSTFHPDSPKKTLEMLAQTPRLAEQWKVSKQGFFETLKLSEILLNRRLGITETSNQVFEFAFMRLLQEGEAQNSFDGKDLGLIEKVANKLQTTSDPTKKHAPHIELKAMVRTIANKILKNESAPEQTYIEFISNFYNRNYPLLTIFPSMTLLISSKS
jgi:hypothetical protein